MDQRSEVVHCKPVLRNGTGKPCSQLRGCMGKGVSPSAQASGDLKGFPHFSAVGNGVLCWGLLGTSLLNSSLLL